MNGVEIGNPVQTVDFGEAAPATGVQGIHLTLKKEATKPSVRLMQRIGRVDRKLNPETDARIVADHPDRGAIRGKVAFWNFLAPDDLEELLRLYARVALKTLRISRTFGIEGRKLLTPGDDYEALRDFTHAYEGTTSPLEEMSLEYQKLLKDNAGLLDHVEKLPGRVFSSKQHPTPDSRAVFFCCALPSPPPISREGADTGLERWTTYGGATSWYLYDLNSEAILDEPTKIIRFIRRSPSTPSKQEWHS